MEKVNEVVVQADQADAGFEHVKLTDQTDS